MIVYVYISLFARKFSKIRSALIVFLSIDLFFLFFGVRGAAKLVLRNKEQLGKLKFAAKLKGLKEKLMKIH